jgi:hypothetical protein
MLPVEECGRCIFRKGAAACDGLDAHLAVSPNVNFLGATQVAESYVEVHPLCQLRSRDRGREVDLCAVH